MNPITHFVAFDLYDKRSSFYQSLFSTVVWNFWYKVQYYYMEIKVYEDQMRTLLFYLY